MKKKTVIKLYKDTQQKLGGANDVIYKQMRHIELLNSQLAIQDKAIVRKDEQYEALKKLYKDDLINGSI